MCREGRPRSNSRLGKGGNATASHFNVETDQDRGLTEDGKDEETGICGNLITMSCHRGNCKKHGDHIFSAEAESKRMIFGAVNPGSYERKVRSQSLWTAVHCEESLA